MLHAARGQCWIAYSGGLDSSVLLAAAHRLAPTALQVVHVHHGISRHADAWERHCRDHCARLGLPLTVLRVAAATPPRGTSPEAHARTLRYRALKGLLQKDDGLYTAHHRTDQAETLLLALLRGAGAEALGAMPERRRLGAGWLLRPLLAVDRAQLEQCARDWGLTWIEDDTNRSLGPDRNYLRHRVWPPLSARWPALAATLGRAAHRQQEAATLLAGVAARDLDAMGAGECLPLKALMALAPPRRDNAWRHWLKIRAGRAAPRWLIEQLPALCNARANRNPVLHWQGMELQRFHGALYLHPALPPSPASSVSWQVQHPIQLPPGTLHALPVTGRGLRPQHTRDGCLELRFRTGGERLCTGGSLKKFLQQRAVFPWLRARLPLVYSGGVLVCIPGLWTAPSARALPGTAGLEPSWQPPISLHATPG